MEWRIFFIGPMGPAKHIKGSAKKGSAKSVDYSAHLPKLHTFLVNHLTKEHSYTLSEGDGINSATLEKGDERIVTIIPSTLYGPDDIPTNVFDAIDDSDLVIADLSGNRPAVIYELAFCHALGIRTIVIGGPQEMSFYFSQTRFAEVDFQADQLASADLKGKIDSWLKDRNKRFDSPNPLTDFYGAPLPDISAASGLAAGFYNNFARPILVTGEIIQRKERSRTKEEVHKLKGFIVLRPEDLSQRIDQMENKLSKELLAYFAQEEVKRGEPDKMFVRTKEGPRIPFFLVRDYMIDIPRTMFSLVLSPRLRGKKDKALKNMQGVLVERFCEAVKKLLKDDPNIEEERFHFGSVEEIPSIIETGESKTWVKP